MNYLNEMYVFDDNVFRCGSELTLRLVRKINDYREMVGSGVEGGDKGRSRMNVNYVN